MEDSQWTRNEALAVGTTSVKVLEPDSPRKVIYMRNTSTAAQVITINLGLQPAVANKGIVLNAGEYFIDSDSEGYRCFQGTITAIASAINGQLSIMVR